MNTKFRVLLILSLGGNASLIAVILFGVAIWSRGDIEYPPGAPVSQSPSERPVETRDSTFTSNEQLPAAKPPEGQKNEPPNFRDLLAELEAMNLRIVPLRLLEQLEIPALDPAGQVTGEIRDLLALDEDEIESLNRAITQIADRLRQVELQNIQITRFSDTGVTIKIPRVEDFAEEIRADLRRAIQLELGDIDGALLWNIMTSEKNVEYWAGFAGRSTEIDVELVPSADGKLAFTAERRPIVERGLSLPSHQVTMYPTEPERTLEHLESFLGRQNYMIDHLPDDLRTLLHNRE